MQLEFNMDAIKTTEFGVGIDLNGEYEFYLVPVDKDVQTTLLSIAQATQKAILDTDDGPTKYNPAEKHGGTEYLHVDAGGGLDALMRQLHDAENLPLDSTKLLNPETINCYFARFMDNHDQRLTAIRRASQFKGILKNKLIYYVGGNDRLEIVEDKVFKLDRDFDLLLDSNNTYILRPSAFEALGKLNTEILKTVPSNIKFIASSLKFVDFSGVEDYAKKHPRAARYLASIHSQTLSGVDKQELESLCESTGVKIENVNGKISVSAGSEIAFLEVLDRRRYKVDLIPGQPERFRASSRTRLDVR